MKTITKNYLTKTVVFFSILFLILLVPIHSSAQFSGGAGTYEAPFEIGNLADLRSLSENDEHWDKYFVLTQDIDASATQTWNSGLGFSPIGDSPNGLRQRTVFTGHFNGLGYTISNINSNRPREFSVGFFGYVEDATIENLKLVNIDLAGENGVAGLAVESRRSKIKNCLVSGKVTELGQNTAGGGLIGTSVNSDISKSYAMVEISATIAGGFIGNSNSDQINDCWSGGIVDGGQLSGGFVGLLYSGTLKNCYAIGEVNAQLAGGFCGFNDSNGNIENSFFDSDKTKQSQGVGRGDGQGVIALNTSDFSNRQNFSNVGWKLDDVWEMGTINSIDNATRPYLKMQLAPHFIYIRVIPEPAASVSGTGYYRPNERVELGHIMAPRYTFTGWTLNGSTASTANPYIFNAIGSQTYTAVFSENTAFEGGDGTSANPYQIANVNQLQDINTISSLLGKHFVLTADIDASVTKNWNGGQGFEPIGSNNLPFSGSFDGQGHRIKNLYIKRLQQSGNGLFGYTNGATITKVGLDNVNILGKNQTAGFIGQDEKDTEITLSYVTGLITGNSEVGGFVGSGTNTNVNDSYSLARTYGKDTIGGIAGSFVTTRNSFARISNSYVAGRILSDAAAGAIVSHVGNNVSPRSIYDRNTTGLQKGTNFGDLGAQGYSTDEFSIPIFMNNKFDMVNLWQFAYGQDGIKRPILKWENPYVFNLSDDGNGTIDKEPTERILPGVDFPPITAFPNEGFSFSHWLDEDTQQQWTSNPINIDDVDRNYNLEAVFVPNTGNRKVKITVLNTVQVRVFNAVLEWNGSLYRTDANGVVELSGVSDGTYAFTITGPIYIPLNDNIEVNGSDIDIQVELQAGNAYKDRTCTFLVTDGPLPISNAEIFIQKQGEAPQTFFTDALGEFKFVGNGDFDYTVNVPGYKVRSGSITLSRNSILERVELLKMYNLELTITDGTNPLPQAEITFGGTIYQTDNQGVVVFRELVSNSYNFLVSAPGFASTTHSVRIQDKNVTETVALAPPAGPLRSITVRVTDGLRQIQNASIFISGKDVLFAETNAQGQAVLQMVDGNYSFRVSAPRYMLVEQNIVISKDDTIEIVLSGSTRNITLSITDENGIAIPNSTITFYGRTVTTDTNGMARIFNLILGTTYKFTVSAPGYLSTSRNIFMDPMFTFYNIGLRKPATVTFECSDGTNPLPGVRLDFNGNQYVADAQGEIRIPDLMMSMHGRYTYLASIDGYHSLTGGFVLSVPSYTETLVFVPKVDYYDVDFRVEDANSSAISNAKIQLEGSTYYTDTNGSVSIGSMRNGSYPFTASATGYQSVRGTLLISGNDIVRTVVLSSQNQPTFNVSGTVTDNNGNPLENVILKGFDTTVTTDANGHYSAAEVQGWSGNVSPSLQNYIFSPTNVSVNNLQGDVSGNDFIGTPTVNQFTISGTVRDNQGNPMQNVAVNGFSTAVSTDANGVFSVSEAVGWSGTSTVSMQGYSFSPASIQINTLQGDDSGNDFVGAPIVNQISGVVKDDKGDPLSNVTVNGFGFAISTDGVGRYSTYRPQGWSGNISVSLPGYTFAPTNIAINNLQGDSTDNDFTGTPNINRFTVSGTVTDNNGNPLENVILNGFSTTVTTNTSGQYYATESQGWSGNVSPSMQGYNFAPTDIQVNNLQADSNGNDYTGTVVMNRYTVSGTVRDDQGNPLENAILNGFSTTVTTNASGQYSATESQGWSGSISVLLQGYTFSPVNIQMNNLQSDSMGNDFIGTPRVANKFTISGTVRDEKGNPLENVALKGFTTTVISNANGKYSTTENESWSGSIVPLFEDLVFTPQVLTITDLSEDVLQDFKGEKPLNMLVFPNPSYDGKFTIMMPKVDGIKQIQIFKPSGQLVHTTILSEETETYTLENTLSSGLYILKFTVKDGIYEQKILIK